MGSRYQGVTAASRSSAFSAAWMALGLTAAGSVFPAMAADMMEPAPTVKGLTTCDTTAVKTTKIGILAPLSGGGMSADAQDVVNAAQMAIDELNAAGGVCGPGSRYKFEIVTADTEGERNDAVVTGFRRLNSTEGLNFIMTGYASTSNFEIDLMAKAKMPYLFSANSEQTKKIIPRNPAGYPTVWSRVPDYGGYNTDLPPLLDKMIAAGTLKVPSKTVYMIGSDEPFGATIAQGLTDSFKAAGWTIVGTEKVPFQTVTDWRPQLARIRDAKPGIIVNTNATPASDATFFNQFIEQPTNSLIFLQYAPSIPEFGRLTHYKSNGVLFNMLGGGINSRKDTQEIIAKYVKRFGPGGYFSVAAYNDVLLYALCIKKGNDPADQLAIGKCIGSLDVDTPAGRLAFDPPPTWPSGEMSSRRPSSIRSARAGKTWISPPSVAQAAFKQPYWMTTK